MERGKEELQKEKEELLILENKIKDDVSLRRAGDGGRGTRPGTGDRGAGDRRQGTGEEGRGQGTDEEGQGYGGRWCGPD